jgi:hypothetical protein
VDEEDKKPVLSDSDVGALHEQLQESRHRAWAWGRLKKGAKWASVVLLGTVAMADAIGRLIDKVAAWYKQ